MAGTSATTFAPNVTTSRAMIATILWRMAGSPVVNYAMNYTDVTQGQWCSEAIRWATSEGVVTGYGNGLFGTNDPITREQLATMLWRYAQICHPCHAVGRGRRDHQRHRRRLHPHSPGPGHPRPGGGDAAKIL